MIAMKRAALTGVFVLIALLVEPPLSVGAAPLPQAGEGYHTVQAGENLFRISLRYGTTVQLLMQTNGLNDPNRVYVGQQLRIPSGQAVPASSPTPQAAQGGSPRQTVHSVQAGENLFRISLHYGISTRALAMANGMGNVNIVYVGQQLVIPASSAAEPANSAAGSPVILPVPLDRQDHTLSCESSAAGMAAAFFQSSPPQGYADWESYFVQVIPPHQNPHRGFRGNIDGQVGLMCTGQVCASGYGVYAEPVAQALNQAQIGVEARVEYGVDYAAIEQAIKAGSPVLVWVFNPFHGDYNPAAMRRLEIDPETNQPYTLIEGEHVYVVVGVAAEGKTFLVHDPYQGRSLWVAHFSRWDLFNGMRVIVAKSTAR